MERSGLQCREDLVVLGKATALVLGEDELAVAQHVELALAARDVLRLDPVRVQLGCETRSPLVIARSGGAVVDLDRHCRQRTSQSQKSVTTRWPAGTSGAPGRLAASYPGSGLVLIAHVLVRLELRCPPVDFLRCGRGGHVHG
jgi:hypothetical protein